MTLARRAVALVVVVPALLVGCSSGSGGSGSAPQGGGSAGADAHSATVTITAAKGCEIDRTSFGAGAITFTIANKDATGVSEVELLSGERIVGEKENVAAGLGGQFAVRVNAGSYTLYCPGATTEKTAITVIGKASAVDNNVAGLVAQATAGYKRYVDEQVGYLLTATRNLNTTLHGTDLAPAQRAYIAARPFYEKIEPVAESFVNGSQNLDADIDARANDVPPDKWYGYHRIEKGLFQDKRLTGLAAYGDKLVKDVTTLKAKTAALTYTAPDLANGAQGLLDEIAATKITGEEERYSHIDMVDMANNVEGAEQAFAQLQPALRKIDANLAATIAARFTALDTVVDKYRTETNPSGYVLYTSLTDTDRRRLAAAVKAVSEPMSQVAGKVADA
jgi:iron uptake system component EfeO